MMSDEVEVLLEMYKVQVARSEHYENLRAALGSTLVAIAAGLLGLAAFDGKLGPGDGSSGTALAVIGLFGVLATRAHSNRSRRHGKRAQSYREALDRRLPNAGINAERDQVRNRGTFLFLMWEGLHAFIGLIGLYIVSR